LTHSTNTQTKLTADHGTWAA